MPIQLGGKGGGVAPQPRPQPMPYRPSPRPILGGGIRPQPRPPMGGKGGGGGFFRPQPSPFMGGKGGGMMRPQPQPMPAPMPQPIREPYRGGGNDAMPLPAPWMGDNVNRPQLPVAPRPTGSVPKPIYDDASIGRKPAIEPHVGSGDRAMPMPAPFEPQPVRDMGGNIVKDMEGRPVMPTLGREIGMPDSGRDWGNDYWRNKNTGEVMIGRSKNPHMPRTMDVKPYEMNDGMWESATEDDYNSWNQSKMPEVSGGKGGGSARVATMPGRVKSAPWGAF